NILAVDRQGNIAGVASSSGRAFQIPGRVGESAIIGAGLYIDNEVGGAAASGYGEEIIRTCGSFLVVEAMRQGTSPQKACEEACLRIIRINGGNERIKQLGWNILFCAVNKNGEIGCSSIRSIDQKTPQISLIDDTGFHVYNGTNIIF
ncbi:isoaspartyl peptidase/L-asparaginase, partial [candidate division KSB1 bacterium]|nr:isoaspartyl peptidase/L-asparaginase [candidate division KSB1 bacterium]